MNNANDVARTGRARSRAPTGDFRKLIAVQKPAAGELPFVHTSHRLGLRSILREGELQTEPCPFFDDEPLLYLFYGRPAYRVNSQVLSTAIDAYAPVCFILRPGSVKAPRRIFPFDSGAFHGERFSEAMHRKMVRDDFALEPDLSSPQRLVGLYFGDHDRYLRNQPVQDPELPSLAFEASSYHILITSRHENQFDERISAIELQLDEAMPLAGNVEAIVMPDRFAIPEVLTTLDGIGAAAIPYEYIARLRPESYTSSIYQLVRDYYKRGGYL